MCWDQYGMYSVNHYAEGVREKGKLRLHKVEGQDLGVQSEQWEVCSRGCGGSQDCK